jgi:hypothetical protein
VRTPLVERQITAQGPAGRSFTGAPLVMDQGWTAR